MAQNHSHKSVNHTLPKYMCLTAKTQFELAQNIDAAMRDAEYSISQNQRLACYQLWMDQILDQFQEEYGIDFSSLLELSEENSIEDLPFKVEQMVRQCGDYYQLKEQNGSTLEDFRLSFRQRLESCFVDTLDMMQAQSIWRFDIQRSMQKIQADLLTSINNFIFDR